MDYFHTHIYPIHVRGAVQVHADYHHVPYSSKRRADVPELYIGHPQILPHKKLEAYYGNDDYYTAKYEAHVISYRAKVEHIVDVAVC